MQIKSNRPLSFVAITVIYALATLFGVLLYRHLPFSLPVSLLIADVGATVFVFVFSVILKNASVYDPYWSVQPIVIVSAFLFGQEMTAAKLLVTLSIFFWGIRLTANWAYTFHSLSFEDWRYTMLAEKTGLFYPFINFSGIHMVPTLIVYFCTLPAVYIITKTSSTNAGSYVFFTLSVMAAMLQLISDMQMHAFRKHKNGTFIRNGLWKYSRHPNYLGEILMWWGVGLSAICLMPEKWYLLSGAFLNTLLFLFVSIPMADKRQSRKEGFEEYKDTTRMLLPLPKF